MRGKEREGEREKDEKSITILKVDRTYKHNYPASE